MSDQRDSWAVLGEAIALLGAHAGDLGKLDRVRFYALQAEYAALSDERQAAAWSNNTELATKALKHAESSRASAAKWREIEREIVAELWDSRPGGVHRVDE